MTIFDYFKEIVIVSYKLFLVQIRIDTMMKQYLYDTHIHTIETSPCGKIPAADTVRYYADHGYTGLVITDHLHPEFLQKTDPGHKDWDHLVDLYMAGYNAAKKQGDEIGFDVIFGAEMRFIENNNDYLVYNIDEAWLRAHPYVICQTAREFFEKYKDEVLVIHAHPYRDGNQTVFEDAVHGVEMINTNPRHDNHTDLAAELCRRHPEYYIQAGSDMHQVTDRCRAGIITGRRVTNSFEYAELIRSQEHDLYAPDFPEFIEEFRKMKNIRNQ